ncbi:hypothetical protein EVAR_44847_1 [Eumeta japonica]|uniref:Reverse transcriptase domain-containing protein n=1 Tax=Eumeta variegata TaxID=151549 RepID=A0A4C1YNY5_EUMVA|nr:hypothetical protein EVAR_44847_1 [Eumeta japonica]
MDELSVKCLLYADDREFLAVSACEMQEMKYVTAKLIKSLHSTVGVVRRRRHCSDTRTRGHRGRSLERLWSLGEHILKIDASCQSRVKRPSPDLYAVMAENLNESVVNHPTAEASPSTVFHFRSSSSNAKPPRRLTVGGGR